MAVQHGKYSVGVPLDKIFTMGDDSSYTLYWVFGGIILAVAVIVGVVFLVICIKKKKTPGLRINRDDLENILEE
jgi:Ca2+/Na+ antiporter